MKTDDLIEKLTQDLKPVRRAWSPLKFAFLGTSVTVLFISILASLVDLRADLASVVSDFSFFLTMFCFGGLLFSSLLGVSWFSSPGRRRSPEMAGLVLFFVLLTAVVSGWGILELDPHEWSTGFSSVGKLCSMLTLIVASVTGALFFWKARLGASLSPLKSGMLVGLASLGSGGLAITLHCGVGNEMHVVVWHFLVPLIVVILLGTLIGSKVLRW